ncbi:hypothetical protein LF1_55590 [Rubripirellula obstinata]|uniref:Uncharacterized protein n=1 Tax=Rubripirellula obstinata TaxID=406547 RepID=A0A5B1CBX7_9BACT|nr:hypothetical protein LF1_55590 [Rubripirellula obstinata]
MMADNHAMHRSGGGQFFVCLQIFRRHPVMSTVIRLSRGHLLPSSRPAGHNLRMDSMPITRCHD